MFQYREIKAMKLKVIELTSCVSAKIWTVSWFKAQVFDRKQLLHKCWVKFFSWVNCSVIIGDMHVQTELKGIYIYMYSCT